VAKLHEVLAVEKTVVGASDKLLEETRTKFAKYDHYFRGSIKSLKMLSASPENDALQSAAKEVKELPTTVRDTLEYALEYWAKAEDVLYRKNVTNRTAVADVMFRGSTVKSEVPVDELMGLEVRLQSLRGLVQLMPTQDASIEWGADPDSAHKGAYKAVEVDRTTKTEKVTVPVILYEATDKHPAQVKESSKDVVVGIFETVKWTGAATAKQKSEVMANIDELLAEVKQARMRANMVEVVEGSIGREIVDLVMEPLRRV